ncbi:hypothetical protein D9758_004947 [Tetrapyrgos nigripes]|uniref:Uncharacterized protein n=1 Tax=Tetrapyrgos nigripes TaxID=182062 RepID=A0A8H5LWP4_9AGAR|nr:hypothetical protein D9758_004947 [Tetrapyrgos nigripes]
MSDPAQLRPHYIAFGVQCQMIPKTKLIAKSEFEGIYWEHRDLFVVQGEQLKYMGLYSCRSMTHIAPSGIPLFSPWNVASTTSELAKATRVEQDSKKIPPVDVLKSMYTRGELKVECIALQAMGFNQKLYEILRKSYRYNLGMERIEVQAAARSTKRVRSPSPRPAMGRGQGNGAGSQRIGSDVRGGDADVGSGSRKKKSTTDKVLEKGKGKAARVSQASASDTTSDSDTDSSSSPLNFSSGNTSLHKAKRAKLDDPCRDGAPGPSGSHKPTVSDSDSDSESSDSDTRISTIKQSRMRTPNQPQCEANPTKILSEKPRQFSDIPSWTTLPDSEHAAFGNTPSSSKQVLKPVKIIVIDDSDDDGSIQQSSPSAIPPRRSTRLTPKREESTDQPLALRSSLTAPIHSDPAAKEETPEISSSQSLPNTAPSYNRLASIYRDTPFYERPGWVPKKQDS